MYVPFSRRAKRRLYSAVRAPPTCRKPVGEGANRTRGPVEFGKAPHASLRPALGQPHQMSEIERIEPASMRLRADAALVLITVVWGSSFVVVKNVVRDSPPLAFLFFRFLLATAFCLALALRRPRTPGLLRDGAIIGALLAGGMTCQVLGQVETTASKAAFLTGLSVVMTPFAAFARTRRLPSLENTVGIILAGLGFLLLNFPGGAGPINRGDFLVFVCAIIFAFFIVEISLRTRDHDAFRLTTVQLASVAVCAAVVGGVL